jgi:uncharacterized protein DUF6485
MAETCEKLLENKQFCNCTYEPCSRKGKCCECMQYHLKMKQLPACAFPDDVEKSWDRSFSKFVEVCRDRYGM